MSWRKHTERRGYFRKVSPIDTLGSGLNDGRESGLGGREFILGIKCKGPEAGKELRGSGSRGDPCGFSEEGVSQGPQNSTITEILEAMVGVLYFIKFHWPTTPRRRLPPQLWTKNKLVFGWWCRCLSTKKIEDRGCSEDPSVPVPSPPRHPRAQPCTQAPLKQKPPAQVSTRSAAAANWIQPYAETRVRRRLPASLVSLMGPQSGLGFWGPEKQHAHPKPRTKLGLFHPFHPQIFTGSLKYSRGGSRCWGQQWTKLMVIPCLKGERLPQSKLYSIKS